MKLSLESATIPLAWISFEKGMTYEKRQDYCFKDC